MRGAAYRAAVQNVTMSLRAVVRCAMRSRLGLSALSPWVVQAELAPLRFREVRAWINVTANADTRVAAHRTVDRLERAYAQTLKTSGAERDQAIAHLEELLARSEPELYALTDAGKTIRSA